ncbi:MAG TPA: cation-transporting P-type ATPase, partial [Deinococcales bacterium]|nr:cation-transporting P-type ATPase [Deinococcales bacterium]
MPAAAVIAALGVDENRGLSTREAEARAARFGPNELPAEPPVPAWRRLLAQFASTLVLLLVAAAGISFLLWWLEREAGLPFESLVILAIVVLNAGLGYVQEARAEQAVNALNRLSAAEARVL